MNQAFLDFDDRASPLYKIISAIPTSAPDQTDRRGRRNRKTIDIQRHTATAQHPQVTASLFDTGEFASRKQIAIYVQKKDDEGKAPGIESPDSGRGNVLQNPTL